MANIADRIYLVLHYQVNLNFAVLRVCDYIIHIEFHSKGRKVSYHSPKSISKNRQKK